MAQELLTVQGHISRECNCYWTRRMQREWTKMVDNIVNTVVHCSLISSPNCSIIIKTSLGRCKILQPVLLFF